jgi:hypothetical protein
MNYVAGLLMPNANPNPNPNANANANANAKGSGKGKMRNGRMEEWKNGKSGGRVRHPWPTDPAAQSGAKPASLSLGEIADGPRDISECGYHGTCIL